MRSIILIAELDSIGPVLLFHIDEVVYKTSNHQEEDDGLGGKARLDVSDGKARSKSARCYRGESGSIMCLAWVREGRCGLAVVWRT